MKVEPIFCSMSNAYLVEDHEKYILIDAGMPWDVNLILRTINRHTNRLDVIFLTHAHPDHYGGSQKVHEFTQAPVAIHYQDAVLLQSRKLVLGQTRSIGRILSLFAGLIEKLIRVFPPQPNLLLSSEDDLEALGFRVKVIHTPGHTMGSSTLLFSNGTAFVGDLASSTGLPHTQRYFAHDWGALADSLQKLNHRKPGVLFPGHGRKPISGRLLEDAVDFSLR